MSFVEEKCDPENNVRSCARVCSFGNAAILLRPHTLISNLISEYYESTGIGDASSSLYDKKFVQCKSSQYRRMKQEWRSNVYLARSRIQVTSTVVGCANRQCLSIVRAGLVFVLDLFRSFVFERAQLKSHYPIKTNRFV